MKLLKLLQVASLAIVLLCLGSGVTGDNTTTITTATAATPTTTAAEDPSSLIDEDGLTTAQPDSSDDGDSSSSATTNFFINSVHAIAANVSQNLTIHDTKVVWSPFAVVSAINALNNDDDRLLGNGFDSATTYIHSLSPALNVTLINGAFTYDGGLKLNSTRRLTLTTLSNSSSEEDINDVLQHAFLNLTNTLPQQQQHNYSSGATTSPAYLTTPPAPPHYSDNRLLVPSNLTTYLLTSLGLESSWSVPFHPRYAKKAKFYLNSTHIVKTKFLNNIAFNKFANLSTLSNDDNDTAAAVPSSAVAVPLKDVYKTYLIVVKPNNHDDIDKLSAVLDSPNFNFTRDVFEKFKTKRVQLSLPKINIDSQFVLPISASTSMLHISSLKLTYSGLSHNFAPPPAAAAAATKKSSSSSNTAVKFTRLRRRKDDIRMKVNSPFVFYVYDASISGILLSGLVLNPLDDPNQVTPSPSLIAPPLPPPLQTLKEASNRFCMDLFQFSRRRAGIYDNIFIPCIQSFKSTLKSKESVDMATALEALSVGSSRVNATSFQFGFPDYKKAVKKFYSNEINYVNASYVELEMSKVKYLSYPNLDMKVIRLKVPSTTSQYLYVLLPNERSGVGVVEEGLDVHSGSGRAIRFQSLLCQMRDINRRMRIPLTNIHYQRVTEDLRDFTNSTGGGDIGAGDQQQQQLPTSLSFSAVEDEDNSSSSSSGESSSGSSGGPSSAGGFPSSFFARTLAGRNGWITSVHYGSAGNKLHRGSSSKNNKRRYKKMYVDRPFMFVLTEEVNSRGALIAVGRVVVPSTHAEGEDSFISSSSGESGGGSGSSAASDETSSSEEQQENNKGISFVHINHGISPANAYKYKEY